MGPRTTPDLWFSKNLAAKEKWALAHSFLSTPENSHTAAKQIRLLYQNTTLCRRFQMTEIGGSVSISISEVNFRWP
jgi:hypothetical protein